MNKEIKFLYGIILFLVIVFFMILFTGCSKEEDCSLYIKGNLKLEHSGECYYLQQGKRVYLEKEQCANYCD